MSAGERHTSARAYVVVWIALLVLTVVSFTTAPLDLHGFDAAVMLGIAVIKSILVVLIFMHLLESRFANRMVVIVSALFVLILVGLMAADVVTRTTFPAGVQEREVPTALPGGVR